MVQPRRCCSIQALPVEVLGEIFIYDKDPSHLMRVSRVCSLWRAIIIRAPALWTVLSVTYNTMPELVDWQLAKSRNKELDVTLRIDPFAHEDTDDDWSDDDYRPTNVVYASNVRKVFAESSRIRALKATLYRVEVWPPFVHDLLNDGRVWPRLRHLMLSVDYSWEQPATFDMVLPALDVLILDTVTPADWSRLSFGTALTVLDVENTLNFLPMLIQLAPCCNIRRLRLQDVNRVQSRLLSFESFTSGPMYFPHLEQITIWWDALEVPSFVRFLAACSNLDYLNVSVGSLFHRSAPAELEDADHLLQLSYLRLLILESEERQDLFAPLAPMLSGEYLASLEVDNLLLDARIFLPFLAECRDALQSFTLRAAHLTNIDPTASPSPEFPHLSTMKIDLQCEEMFNVSDDPVLPGEMELTTWVFLSMLPTSPPARAMTVEVSGTPLADQSIHHLVRSIVSVSGPITVETVFHNYGGRTPEYEIKLKNATNDASFFVCSFTAPTFGDGFRAMCEVAGLGDRIFGLSMELAYAAQVFLGLPDSLPALAEMVFHAAEKRDISETIRCIVAERRGRLFQSPRLATVTFATGDGEFLPFTRVWTGLLLFFLLHFRAVGTLNEVHHTFEGVDFNKYPSHNEDEHILPVSVHYI